MLNVVKSDVSHTWTDKYDEVQIEDDDDYAILNIIGPRYGTSEISFSDNDRRMSGGLIYYHEGDQLKIRTNGSTRMLINSSGNVGVGTTNPTHKLTVNGSIKAEEITVDTVGADFVFKDDYTLRSLEEVESFIESNNHLLEISSAKEMQENGVGVSELQTKLLQKIEELTLYTIEQNKRIADLEARLSHVGL